MPAPVQPPVATPKKAPVTPPKKAAPAVTPGPVAKRQETAVADTLRARYLRKVRRMIEANKYYPRIAKKLRQTGRVEVQFGIRKDGSICCIEVIGPCRYRKLNKAARRTIERIGRFDPLPEALGISTLKIRVPIRYSLK